MYYLPKYRKHRAELDALLDEAEKEKKNATHRIKPVPHHLKRFVAFAQEQLGMGSPAASAGLLAVDGRTQAPFELLGGKLTKQEACIGAVHAIEIVRA